MNILEKNKLIETYLIEINHLKEKPESKELMQKVQEFDHLKILNEDDWFKFKKQFEMVYAGFLGKMETKNPDLTEGDKRNLMLIKLGFSLNQSADILGVGYRAIQKARQRLSQKVNLDSAKELNAFVEDQDN